MQTTTRTITDLSYDVLERIFAYLPLEGRMSLMHACHSLFANVPLHQKEMRKTYIRQFLTEHPELVKQYSEAAAFERLWEDFIKPFEAVFFKISKPGSLNQPLWQLFLKEGTFKDQLLIEACMSLGFEKLYFQLHRSRALFLYSFSRTDEDFERQLNDSILNDLSFQIPQFEWLEKSTYPATALFGMAKHVHPFLYFTGLAAALYKGRVDVFASLLSEFEANKAFLMSRCFIGRDETTICLTSARYVVSKHKHVISLDNLRKWSPQFKAEFDRLLIPGYAKLGECEVIFELLMAKIKQPEVKNDPLHFLWACYTANTAGFFEKFKQADNAVIEFVYQPQGFAENMRESALSLYARNVHQEDEDIIKILLAHPAICKLMHLRNAYDQTPLQIAISHQKFLLAEAMLAKTPEDSMLQAYSVDERTLIHLMLENNRPAPALQENPVAEDQVHSISNRSV